MEPQFPSGPSWQLPPLDFRRVPLLLVVLVALLFGVGGQVSGVAAMCHRIIVQSRESLQVAALVPAAVGAALLLAHRFTSKRQNFFEHCLTATACASLVLLGVFGAILTRYPQTIGLFFFDRAAQLFALVAVAAVCTIACALSHKSANAAQSAEPYPLAVHRQRSTYDYTLGIAHADDWERCESGPASWVTLPEAGTYCNVMVLGMIGTGKTTQVLGPLMQQAIGKYPDDPSKRVSILAIDYKGSQAAAIYRWAKAMGREDDVYILRPDLVRDAEGTLLIPADRYVSYSPLQGFDEPALLAGEFQDALESVKTKRSPEFFQDVQREFLTHTLTLLMSEQTDLADVQAFAASDDVRKAIIANAQGASSKRAIAYFIDEFDKLSSSDQASLLRGLASQLTMLTNESVRRAFCPGRPNAHAPLKPWTQCLLENPGIVVFSCPPSLYTKSLSRLLALLVLKGFQQAMTRRTDASFAGNKQRPVMLFADEAHAVFNRELSSFLAVSRESRVVNILATQSVSQIPYAFRHELLGGCRTRYVLASDDETARDCEKSLGVVEEVAKTVSFSEGQRPTSAKTRETGISTNRIESYAPRERPRFNAHALRHIPLGRGVAHVFDGQKLRPSCYLKTTPWHRLPFYLLDPRAHPSVACERTKEAIHHYKRSIWGQLRCKNCQKILTRSEASDYRAVLPALRTMKLCPQRHWTRRIGGGS